MSTNTEVFDRDHRMDVHQIYIVSGLEAPDKPYVTEDIPYVYIYMYR